MPKKAHQKRSVKAPQDAPVTRASAEAATGDGDGGRVLERLDTQRRKKAGKAAGKSLRQRLNDLDRLVDKQRSQSLKRHAEPELSSVAASASGASARVRELPPSTGGAVTLRHEGGDRPEAADGAPTSPHLAELLELLRVERAASAVKEWPATRRARIRKEQRKSQRASQKRARRMLQLLLPVVIRTLDLEPLLRGEVIEAMAAVLLRAWDGGSARTEALEEA
jgi:hypothetical protein